MDYESFIASIEQSASDISDAQAGWLKNGSDAEAALVAACAGETVDVQGLQNVRASLSQEQDFFRKLQQQVAEHRVRVGGFKKFYTVAAPAVAAFVPVEEPAKAGLFGRLKRPTVVAAPAALPEEQAPPAHSEQRAFIAMKEQIARTDAVLGEIKTRVAETAEMAEELAFGFKAEVVAINAALRSQKIGSNEQKKLATRRFYLEEAISLTSERVVFLGLQTRVLARMHSTEILEDPFEEFNVGASG